MRAATAVAVVAIVTVLVGVGALAVGGLGGVGGIGDEGRLVERWVSDPGTEAGGNHHEPAVANGTVFAPVSGSRGQTECALVAYGADDGTERWRAPVPDANCTIHAVADPTVADYDDDGVHEVLAASTTEELVAYDPETGDREFSFPLSRYGYSAPVVADVTPGGGEEIVVTDVAGVTFVLGPDGTERWRVDTDQHVETAPTVADFDADGTRETLVAGDRALVLLGPDGEVEWEHPTDDRLAAWVTTADADGDPAVEVFAAFTRGEVVAVDGASGETEWRREVGRFPAVHDAGDGDGDGAVELYVGTRDGTVRALDATTGETEWATPVAEGLQMMPPPVLGDVDGGVGGGDPGPELVVASNDGTVTVLDPDGTVRTTYSRDQPVYTHPVFADVDGDGDREVFVMYSDGRVVALDYRS
ncbi:PQQ-binding-like beta-propeller repeat protein [Halobium salinum]|uniref:PQQ-binding-like beta-propeller repeat protein n=1 Tax=Halobium salinum TaxID=1364940 RepID=A0ABD5P7M5_9EURY|nr:PQQ-binding-like beta-propeller repeat protein [Halobium salinum]